MNQHLKSTSLSLCCLVVAGLLTSACPSGGKLEDPDRFVLSEDGCDVTPIFNGRCASGACHGPDEFGAPLGGTDLISEGLEARLLNQPALAYEATANPESCPSTPELLVDPGDPEKSLLLTKLLGTHSCGAGMPTPFPAAKLSDVEIECVRSWILNVIAEQGPSENGGGGQQP